MITVKMTKNLRAGGRLRLLRKRCHWLARSQLKKLLVATPGWRPVLSSPQDTVPVPDHPEWTSHWDTPLSPWAWLVCPIDIQQPEEEFFRHCCWGLETRIKEKAGMEKGWMLSPSVNCGCAVFPCITPESSQKSHSQKILRGGYDMGLGVTAQVPSKLFHVLAFLSCKVGLMRVST